MSKSIRVGVIGAGNVSSSIHLPVLLALEGVEVSWVCDKDAKRARDVAMAYGVGHADLAGGPGSIPPADVVLLAIPYGVREPFYVELASRRVAVLVEKPFARTVEEHKRLCSAFPEARLACGLNRRAMGLVHLCRELIANRLFGRLYRTRFGHGNLGGITTRSGFTAQLSLAGGGPLLETGVHGIDLIHFAVGASASTLTGGRVVMDEGFDIHAEGVFDLVDRFGDTIPMEVEISRLRNTINRVEFEFENATVFYSIFSIDGAGTLWVRPHGSKIAYTLRDSKDNYPYTWQQVAAEFWRTFLHGLDSPAPNYTSATQSLLTTHAVEQLYRCVSGSP